MAKKKKLNKRAVVLLSLVGVGLLLTVVLVMVAKGGEDPLKLEQQGDAAMGIGGAAAADRDPGKAVVAYKKALASHPEKPKIYVKLAKALLEHVKNPTFSDEMRAELFKGARDSLMQAVSLDRGNIEAQRMLTDMYWDAARQGRNRDQYFQEAKALLLLDPKDHETWYRSGSLRAFVSRSNKQDYFDDAAKELKKAVELKNDEMKYWLALAELYEFHESKTEVEAAYADARKALPNDARIRVAYADWLTRQGPARKADVLKMYEEARDVEKDNAAGNVGIAHYYISENQYDKALDALNAAKTVDPADHTIYVQMSRISMQQKQLDKALDVLRDGIKAMVVSPEKDTPAERARVQNGKIQLSHALAQSLMDLAQSSKPAERGKLMEEVAVCLESLSGASRAYHSLVSGRIAFLEARYDEAQRLLEEGQQLTGGRLDLRSAEILSKLYQAKGEAKKADDVIASMGNGPQQRFVQHNLKAEHHILSGRYQQALREIEDMLAIDPAHQQALLMKTELQGLIKGVVPQGLNLNEQNARLFSRRAQELVSFDAAAAVKLMRQVYDARPDDLQVIRGMVGIYISAKDEASAKTVLAAAKKKFPTDKNIDRAMKRLDEPNADKRFEMSLAEAEEIEDPFERAAQKGLLYLQKNDVAGADRHLREAARLKPDHLGVIRLQFDMAMGANPRNMDLAKAVVERAEKADPQGWGVWLSVRYAKSLSDHAKAIKILEGALKTKEDKGFYVELGDCLLALSQHDQAEKAFLSAENIDPYYFPALKGLAVLAVQRNQPEAVDRYVNRAYEINPRDPQIEQLHMRLMDERQDIDKAIAQRKKWMQDKPDDIANIISLASNLDRKRTTNSLREAEALLMALYQQRPPQERLAHARRVMEFYVRHQRFNDLEVFQNKVSKEVSDASNLHYVIGDVYRLRNDPVRAEASFKKSIEIDDKNALSHSAYAQLLLRLNRLPEAEFHAKRYADLVPGIQTDKLLAGFYLEVDKPADAMKLLNKVLQAHPDDAQAMSALAAVHVRQNNPSEAMNLLNRSVAANDKQPESWVRRADLRIRLGQFAEARQDLARASELGGRPQVMMTIGKAYDDMGDTADAERVLKDAIRNNPRDAELLQVMCRFYLQQAKWTDFDNYVKLALEATPNSLDLLWLQAEGFRRRNSHDKRAEVLKKAVAIAETAPAVRDYLLALLEARQAQPALDEVEKYKGRERYEWVQAMRARALHMKREAGQAEALFKEVLAKATPEDLDLVLSQVKATYGIEEAIKKLESWDARKDDWMMALWLGNASLEQGDAGLAKAEQMLRKAHGLAKSEEDKAQVMVQIGVVHQRSNQMDKAEQVYLDAIKVLGTRHAGCLNNLAYLYAERNMPEKALPHARKAAELSANPDIQDTYGWTLVKLKEYGQAESVLSSAARVADSSGIIHYHLGYLYEMTGRPDKALATYKKAQFMVNDKDPLHKTLQDAVGRVQK